MPTPLLFSTLSISSRIAGSSIVAGMVQGAPSAIFFAQNLARARLRQPGDRDRQLEGRNRPDLLADEADAFLLDLGDRPVRTRLEHDEAAGDLALERVGVIRNELFSARFAEKLSGINFWPQTTNLGSGVRNLFGRATSPNGANMRANKFCLPLKALL